MVETAVAVGIGSTPVGWAAVLVVGGILLTAAVVTYVVTRPNETEEGTDESDDDDERVYCVPTPSFMLWIRTSGGNPNIWERVRDYGWWQFCSGSTCPQPCEGMKYNDWLSNTTLTEEQQGDIVTPFTGQMCFCGTKTQILAAYARNNLEIPADFRW